MKNRDEWWETQAEFEIIRNRNNIFILSRKQEHCKTARIDLVAHDRQECIDHAYILHLEEQDAKADHVIDLLEQAVEKWADDYEVVERERDELRKQLFDLRVKCRAMYEDRCDSCGGNV